ncbi:ParB-like nuclease domain-containing protein [Cribrihabitans marinus]|uniref:ParB-like nuclease domain-containing protein n=1 Tax=Cribrihabitans marinus TaxID=1227549 RepID=A0A1H7DXA4_9RHOB|nr:ParB N-terminal domain-containing protein [Cribrihabitans marinus]SEK06376.1 ParB-like nuclease domain-containing protein [Cribrihabitans marinus]
MARKRKLNAQAPEGGDAEPPEAAARGGMGGMWAGSAMNLLQQRIEAVHGSLAAGVMNGTVVLELDPGQIEDAVGSDRIGDWAADPEFQALKRNIQRRGQTQPIRVRPRDPDWRPDPQSPRDTDAVFVVQSGRRRLEVCRQLGRRVLAVLSTEAGATALADLEERFHENTMRRNLTGFEELLSIGLLAESLKDLSQDEIAARLEVSQNDVSLGLSCVKYRDDILAQVDVANTPKREYRGIIPRLRRGEGPNPAKPAGQGRAEAARGRFVGEKMTVEMRTASDGLRVKVKMDGATGVDLDTLAEQIARLLSRG